MGRWSVPPDRSEAGSGSEPGHPSVEASNASSPPKTDFAPGAGSWAAHRIWFQQIAEYISDPVFLKDRHGRFVMANEALKRHFSEQDATDIIGRTDLELHPADIAQQFFREEQSLMASDQAMVGHDEFVYLPGGEKQWLSTTKVPLRDENGAVIGLFGIARDITQRKKSELLREGQSKVLEMIAAGMPLADVLSELLVLIEEQLGGIQASILVLDKDGEHLKLAAAPSLPIALRNQLDGLKVGPQNLCCGAAAFRGETVCVADIAQDPFWEAQCEPALDAGLMACTSMPIKSLKGQVFGTLALYFDQISVPSEIQASLMGETARIAAIAIERELAQEKIRFLAENDTLTGLPNRSQLERRMAELIRSNTATKEKFAVVFVDLDRFKAVNDSLGHSAGDRVLKIMADGLADSVRAEDMVARFGGDEFVIVMKGGVDDPASIRPLLDRVQAEVARPVVFDSQTFEVFSSLGIARYPEDGNDVETLLKHADDAMYEAKSFGRNCYRFYSATLAEQDALKLNLLQDLRTGLRDGQFFLEYQPQFDLKSGQMNGVEALVRWDHPLKGRLLPGNFIAAAEDSGLISELGNWVLQEACRQRCSWDKAASDPVVMSVNVSAQQFFGSGLIDKIKEVLGTTGLPPELLELELTESSLIKDPDQCIETMTRLRDMGVQIALDDFGTGYSSLSALCAFPLNKLKIDRAFVQNMDRGSRELVIARAIVSLGHELGMRVIAEGVETESQMGHLKALDCNDVQGFLTGRPMSGPKLEALLEEQHRIGGFH